MLPDQYNPEIDPQELARVAGVMLRAGTVADIDHATARVRFQSGGITTDWIPWFEQRANGASGNRTWRPPVIGAQGLLLAPGGDLGRAVILPGVFSDAMPAGGSRAGLVREDFDGSNFWQWESGELSVTCTEKITLSVDNSTLVIDKNQIELRAGGAWLRVGANVIQASSDVIAGGVSLVRHVHIGVMPGPALSGPPVGGGGGGGGGEGSAGEGGFDGWSAPSDPGTDDADKSILDIPIDATGVYRGAIYTRSMKYGEGNTLSNEEIERLYELDWIQPYIQGGG